MNMRQDLIPKALKDIIACFEANGHEVYIAGGSVRNAALGVATNDYDLTTDAVPEEIFALFPNAKMISGRFWPLVGINTDVGIIEISTMLVGSDYARGRPTRYLPTTSIISDLSRRDATINAMAVNLNNGQLYDPYGGMNDLGAKVIRAVGDPELRILESPIRMMRYLRFATQFKFTLDEKLRNAIEAHKYHILRESWDAIGREFLKGMACKSTFRYLHLLRSVGLMSIILPEATAMRDQQQNKHHNFSNVYMHSLGALTETEEYTPYERVAVFLHDVGKPSVAIYRDKKYGYSFPKHEVEGAFIARDICLRFRFPARESMLIFRAVRHHMYPINTRKKARRFVAKVSDGYKSREDIEHAVEFCMNVRRADKLSPRGQDLTPRDWETEAQLVAIVLEEQDAINVSDLAVNGHDIMNSLGIQQGRLVGDILSYLLELVINEDVANERGELISKARNYRAAIGA